MHEKEKKAAQLLKDAMSEKDKAALRYVLQDQLGRFFIARLFDATLIYSPLGNDRMELDEGRRRVGLEYLRYIRSLGLEGMDALHTMEKEYANYKLELERMKETWKT